MSLPLVRDGFCCCDAHVSCFSGRSLQTRTESVHSCSPSAETQCTSAEQVPRCTGIPAAQTDKNTAGVTSWQKTWPACHGTAAAVAGKHVWHGFGNKASVHASGMDVSK